MITRLRWHQKQIVKKQKHWFIAYNFVHHKCLVPFDFATHPHWQSSPANRTWSEFTLSSFCSITTGQIWIMPRWFIAIELELLYIFFFFYSFNPKKHRNLALLLGFRLSCTTTPNIKQTATNHSLNARHIDLDRLLWGTCIQDKPSD